MIILSIIIIYQWYQQICIPKSECDVHNAHCHMTRVEQIAPSLVFRVFLPWLGASHSRKQVSSLINYVITHWSEIQICNVILKVHIYVSYMMWICIMEYIIYWVDIEERELPNVDFDCWSLLSYIIKIYADTDISIWFFFLWTNISGFSLKVYNIWPMANFHEDFKAKYDLNRDICKYNWLFVGYKWD